MMPIKRFSDILDEINYKDWQIRAHADGQNVYLQVSFNAANALTGDAEHWTGRKWRLSSHMTRSEVVQTALKAVLAAEEHEARERFKYRGRSVFGPHINVDALWTVCDQTVERAPNQSDICDSPALSLQGKPDAAN